MANLIITEQDAERLREIAQRENRPVEEIVSRLIDSYTGEQPLPENWERNFRAKLYREARTYWRQVDDSERLSLTDEQLDEQFWCIDPDGIPRLNSDQDTVSLPYDGLLAMAEVAEREGFSATETDIDYRKILNEEFPEYLLHRMQDNDGESATDR